MQRPEPYVAPRVRVHPPQSWPERPHPGASTSAFIVLNTRTGALHAEPTLLGFNENDNYGWYDPSRDLWVIGYGWHRRPTLLAWRTHGWSWTDDADGVAQHLHRIAPTAQHLLDHLEPVPGTSDWDWTPPATAAEARIRCGTSSVHAETINWDEPLPERSDYGVVALSELLDHDPSLVVPAWADMSDAQLDRVAERFTGDAHGRRWLPSEKLRLELCDRYQFGWYEGKKPQWSNNQPIYIVRARADLRRLRDTLVTRKTGLPATPAQLLIDLDNLPTDFTPNCTDADLARIAARMDAEFAADPGAAAVGTLDVLHGLRDRARARVRRETEDIGKHVAALEAELAHYRAIRLSLTAQVIGFHEEPEWDGDDLNFAEVGRLASMTRQGARNSFASIAGQADTGADHDALIEKTAATS